MVLKEIINRRSVREFKPDEVPEKLIEELIKAAQFAHTSRNNRAAEFIVIRSQETKNKLFDILGQEFIKNAPVLIVAVTDTTKTNQAFQDLSLASQNIFLQATALGLGTVWKNVREERKASIRELLGIPSNFTLVNIIPVGFPEAKPLPHINSDFSKKRIHKEKW
ncbi:MAG: nitroreductase family protein [Candidatus Diapherotrites archaeon]